MPKKKKASKPKTNPKTDQHRTVERQTSLGTTLRLKLEPLPKENVKIIEYYRKPKGSDKFRRVKQEEKQIHAFSDLKLNQSYNEVFPNKLKEAA